MSDFSFSADELAGMRDAQRDHMLDECVVLSFAEGTRNDFNEADAPTYTAGDPLPCGLDMRSGSERHGDSMTVIQYDASIRLPLSTVLKETDHIQVVGRFGEFHSTLTYEIVSPIQRGPSGIRLLLRKVVV